MIGIYLIGLVAMALAVAVVAFRHPIYSVLALIGHLLAVALLFLTLQAEFLAAVQILVYAGAIMVLFLFVIMLVAPRPGRQPRRQWFRGAVAGLLMAGLLLTVTAALQLVVRQPLPGRKEAVPELFGTAKGLGQLLFTKYLFPFEATSLLVLVAILAVLLLSREESRKEEAP